jgi:hypothetical protein
MPGKRHLSMSRPEEPSAQPATDRAPGPPEPAGRPRRFDFARDTFAFANELRWEYRFDTAAGKTFFTRREPKPDYALRCFVLVRAARQFFFHARFEPNRAMADDETHRRLIRRVLAGNPRRASPAGEETVIPGYAGLREFSRARELLLKAECGGAWRSYFLRSHWRMVFPISRAHQARAASGLLRAALENGPPIIHLVRFPALTINHGMVLFSAVETAAGARFEAYDPNDPERPATLAFDRGTRSFSLPANQYWAGGRVDVIHIFRSWLI